jgi:hypothetical protein
MTILSVSLETQASVSGTLWLVSSLPRGCLVSLAVLLNAGSHSVAAKKAAKRNWKHERQANKLAGEIVGKA